MIKIIKEDEFELDITHLGFNYTEENHWFTDELVTKYSFPIEIPLNLNNYFQKFESYLNNSHESYVDIIIQIEGKIELGTLEVEEIINQTAKAVIRFGFEEFPGFSKKLNELNLERLTVADIRTHAESKLNKNWPETNYNFPRVYFPFYDLNSSVWKHYSNFINLRSTTFETNYADLPNNEYFNKTIIQPLPHLLHVLSTAFSEEGYSLRGDILTDPDFSIANIFASKKTSIIERPESIAISVTALDKVVDTSVFFVAYWEINQEILHHGKFRVTGSFKSYANAAKYFQLNGVQVYYTSYEANGWISFDFEITTTAGADILTFRMFDHITDDTVAHINIIPLEIYDENGEVINYIADTNEIDLINNVPDMTVGNLFEICRKWKNLTLDVKGNEVWVNYIQKEHQEKEVLNFSQYEIKEPTRRMMKDKSYLLKFKDINNEDYSFSEMYIDKSGNSTSGFTKNDETQTTEIDAIPLPLELKPLAYELTTNVQANSCIVDDDSKLMIVLYDGTASSSNTGKTNNTLLIPNIFSNHYALWFLFRIKSISFTWVFKALASDLVDFTAKKIIYAYGRLHVIKTLNRSRINPKEEEIEIETES